MNDGQTLRDKIDVLNERELAQLLELEPQTLAVWRMKKNGPDFVKVGKHVLYRRADVMDWLNSNIVMTNRTVAS